MKYRAFTSTAASAALKQRFPVKASIDSSLSELDTFYLMVLMDEKATKLENVVKEEALQCEEKMDIVRVEEDKSAEDP